MGKGLSVDFGAINEQNVAQLKKLNSSCFPIQYNESFYKEVATQHKTLGTDDNLCKFAYWNGLVVGAICTRIEAAKGDGASKLYIMTLGVLAAYRGHGIGSKLLQSVLDYYEQEKDGPLLAKVQEIYLHVQTNNHDALHFYERFGFEQGGKIENYYKRIDPPDCFIVYKKLR